MGALGDDQDMRVESSQVGLEPSHESADSSLSLSGQDEGPL